MRISLTTSGGWGAALNLGRPPQVLDSATLSDEEARQLSALVAAARAEPQPGRTGRTVPDAATYRLALDDGATLSATDADMPDGFASLLAYVQERSTTP
ncbi:protealysin inhibitor emfourin [Cryptosporangium sp. NPDC051539]|uniref:protealysin inhibitor emfourin n=1 Tax=Cryptosporangium sp. NPDC051539 TaxID=3363962 RepID=UPI0037A6D9C4